MNEITWGEGGTGGSLRGYYESPWTFEETVARLITASGQAGTNESDGYKTSVEFRGTFAGQHFALYDYKEDRAIHIGGLETLNIAALRDALTAALSTVIPSHYTAKEHYDEKKGHSWKGSVPKGDPADIGYARRERARQLTRQLVANAFTRLNGHAVDLDLDVLEPAEEDITLIADALAFEKTV